MVATWSIPLGIVIFSIATLVAIYFYTKQRKFSTLFYIGAVATYIFSVFYAWDVFEFSENIVLLLLAFSVILMFGIGWYFNSLQKPPKHKKK